MAENFVFTACQTFLNRGSKVTGEQYIHSLRHESELDFIGGVLQACAIASFAILALYGGDTRLFGAVMMFDNFGVSVAGVALVTYMSSLTTLGYTATQYALLSSTYAIVGKTLKGFSGAIVEGLQAQGHTLMESYAIFFVGAGAIGLPAVLLCFWLAAAQRRRLLLQEV